MKRWILALPVLLCLALLPFAAWAEGIAVPDGVEPEQEDATRTEALAGDGVSAAGVERGAAEVEWVIGDLWAEPAQQVPTVDEPAPPGGAEVFAPSLSPIPMHYGGMADAWIGGQIGPEPEAAPPDGDGFPLDAWLASDGEPTADPSLPETVDEAMTLCYEQTVEAWIPLGGGADSDLLFAGFVDRMLWGETAATGSAGAKLSGATRQVYDELRALTADIAAGRRTSIQAQIRAQTLGMAGKKLPAQGLCAQTLEEAAGLDIEAALHALLRDCSFDLFWLDRSGTGGVGAVWTLQVSEADGKAEAQVKGLRLALNVSPVYAGGDTLSLDGKIIGSVLRAAANVSAILDGAARLDDRNKLLAYRDAVCALVRYDARGDAVDSTRQLLRVFDGDTTTNVACEGYARAFKALCDLSDFRGDVRCELATGVMSGAQGAGRHMWNLVTLDGKAWLADVTNSDAETAGADGSLFLAGYARRAGTDTYTYPGGITYTLDAEALRRCASLLSALAEADGAGEQ